MGAECIFHADGERFAPTEQARGPWDPRALHGGAPAALITRAFEQHEPVEGLQIARLGFELLRPVPLSPLSVDVRTIRPGRRVQELAAELHAEGADGPELICRANALRVAEIGEGVPEPPSGALASGTLPGLEEAEPVRFSLDRSEGEASFAGSAMEMRFLDDPWRPGPGRVWMRLRHALVDDQDASPLARLAATADFGNGSAPRCPSTASCSSTPTFTFTCIASRAASGSGSMRGRCFTTGGRVLPRAFCTTWRGRSGGRSRRLSCSRAEGGATRFLDKPELTRYLVSVRIGRAAKLAEEFDPSGVPMDDTSDLRSLAETVDAVRAADARVRELVARARANGRSWGEIGIALGVSRQAARERFAEKINA